MFPGIGFEVANCPNEAERLDKSELAAEVTGLAVEVAGLELLYKAMMSAMALPPDGAAVLAEGAAEVAVAGCVVVLVVAGLIVFCVADVGLENMANKSLELEAGAVDVGGGCVVELFVAWLKKSVF